MKYHDHVQFSIVKRRKHLCTDLLNIVLIQFMDDDDDDNDDDDDDDDVDDDDYHINDDDVDDAPAEQEIDM